MIGNLMQYDQIYPIRVNEEDSAELLINFLECPFTFKKEVTIFNKNCKGPDPESEYVFPKDAIYKTYYDNEIPAMEDMAYALKANNYMVTAVAALDRADKKRITVLAFTDEMMKNLSFIKYRFALVTYKPGPDPGVIRDIIDYLEGYY